MNMKKIIMLALMLVMTIGMSAQDGGLFKRGEVNFNKEHNAKGTPVLPGHGQTGNQSAPISGVAFPLAFAAGYLAIKNRKKD